MLTQASERKPGRSRPGRLAVFRRIKRVMEGVVARCR